MALKKIYFINVTYYCNADATIQVQRKVQLGSNKLCTPALPSHTSISYAREKCEISSYYMNITLVDAGIQLL